MQIKEDTVGYVRSRVEDIFKMQSQCEVERYLMLTSFSITPKSKADQDLVIENR